MKRRYPSAPIPAVSGVIFDDEKRVLLIRRASHPSKGKWSFPGGVVHLGEELEDALKREVLEECGLQVEVGLILAVTSRIIRDVNGDIQYHYILLDYLCRWIGGRLRPSSDADDARWFSLEEVSELDLTDGTLDVIRAGHMKVKKKDSSVDI